MTTAAAMPATWEALRTYQRDALVAVRDAKAPRVIASMATGLGKGHIAGHLTEALGSNRVLYLAHREELINQLRTHVARVLPWTDIGVERAGDRARDWQPCVIASVPTLRGNRLAQMSPERFDAIVVDECHHATAAGYVSIFEHFGLMDGCGSKTESPRVRLVGLTATPSRGDGVGLHNVFDDIVYKYPIGDAIRDKWLVPVHAYQIETGVSLDGVGTKGAKGDFKDGELARAVNVDSRNATVFDACQQKAPGLKTLVFCATVEHAQNMAGHFAERGVPAEWIAGTMDSATRARVLAWYAATPAAVLCNVAIVSEGTDIPSVECVVMARPTRSSTLYAQAMGRGTRLAKGARDYDHSVELGKPKMILLDITDSIADAGRRAVRVGDIFGLPIPTAKLDGEDILEVAAEQQRLLDIRQEAKAARTAALGVDLFTTVEPPSFCTLRWLPVGDGYRISVPEFGTLRVTTDMLDRWTVELFDKALLAWRPMLPPSDTERQAIERAEEMILAAAPSARYICAKDAKWHRDSPTEKQVEFARKLGIAIPPGATKGQVSVAIDRAMASRKGSVRRVGARS